MSSDIYGQKQIGPKLISDKGLTSHIDQKGQFRRKVEAIANNVNAMVRG